MNHDHIDDLDALWGQNGNQNEGIKSDFDNFSTKKSIKDQFKDQEM